MMNNNIASHTQKHSWCVTGGKPPVSLLARKRGGQQLHNRRHRHRCCCGSPFWRISYTGEAVPFEDVFTGFVLPQLQPFRVVEAQWFAHQKVGTLERASNCEFVDHILILGASLVAQNVPGEALEALRSLGGPATADELRPVHLRVGKRTGARRYSTSVQGYRGKF